MGQIREFLRSDFSTFNVIFKSPGFVSFNTNLITLSPDLKSLFIGTRPQGESVYPGVALVDDGHLCERNPAGPSVLPHHPHHVPPHTRHAQHGSATRTARSTSCEKLLILYTLAQLGIDLL